MNINPPKRMQAGGRSMSFGVARDAVREIPAEQSFSTIEYNAFPILKYKHAKKRYKISPI